MIYHYRNVNLQYLGVCMGVDERGNRVPVIFPCAGGDRQRVNVAVQLINVDGAWAAGVVTLQLGNTPEGPWADAPGGAVQIAKPVGYDVLEDVAATSIVAAYGALRTTTVNVAESNCELIVNVTDIN